MDRDPQEPMSCYVCGAPCTADDQRVWIWKHTDRLKPLCRAHQRLPVERIERARLALRAEDV